MCSSERSSHTYPYFLRLSFPISPKIDVCFNSKGSVDHLGLTFVADKPPPFHVFAEVALMAAEAPAEYFS
jgi:hypothetical protein